MGFDFAEIAPLLPSHCGFSFVFGVSFLVSSSVFLSVIVQQLVVILVFSQEGVRTRPSTPPTWFLLRHWKFILLKRAIRVVASPPQGNKKGIQRFHLWTDVENVVYSFKKEENIIQL